MDMFADGGTLKFSPSMAETVTEETSEVGTEEVILENVPVLESEPAVKEPAAPEFAEPIRGLW
jgi:hypothetical protein